MEKQSIFQILSQSLSCKLPERNQNWLLVHCKGYPDITMFQFLNQIYKISQNKTFQFFYLGDFDVYGFDIFLNYAIGNECYVGLWKVLKYFGNLEWLIQIENNKHNGFKHKFSKNQQRKQNEEDKKKSQQILLRQYFNLQKLERYYQDETQKQKQQENLLFMEKMRAWKSFLQKMLKQGYQCEAQSYFKYSLYPFDLIELMIKKQIYL